MNLFHREHISFITAGILVFLVCTSKNILIFNEETLVALSFLGFVIFSYVNLQESIVESFQARSDAIQNELQNYLSLKEEFLQELVTEHQKQEALHTLLHDLRVFSCEELARIGQVREESFSGVCRSQILQKLKTLQSTQQGFQTKIQNIFSLGLRSAVLAKFQKSKATLQKTLLKQAITQLTQAQTS